MQLKMEQSSGKSKPPQQQQSPPSSTVSLGGGTASSSTATSQHQNGSTFGGGGAASNGSKFRSRSSITPSSSSMPSTSAVSGYQLSQQQHRFTNTLPLRILVLKDLVGAIIGRGGGTIKQITQDTHARVDVHRKESSASNENVIMIYGNPENCSQACRRILDVMIQEARSLNRPEEVCLKILASNSLIGRIIGKGGNTIKRIMQQTDTKITVSSANIAPQINLERIISIVGVLDNMCKAEVLISQKLRQCFESDLYHYQQSLLYGGLHSPIAPIMSSQQAGPLSTGYLTAPHPSQAASMPYQHLASSSTAAGGLSQSLSGRTQAGVLPGSHTPGSPVTSPAGGGGGGTGRPGGSSHHMQVPQSAPAFYGGYGSLPYIYSHGPAATGNIPGAYGSLPASTPYMSPIPNYLQQTVAQPASIENVKEKVCVFIPNSVVGAIIGRGGQTIREMMNLSNSSIKVAQPTEEQPVSSPSSSTSAASPDSSSSSKQSTERKVTIVGTPNAQYQAQYYIFQKVLTELINQQSALQMSSSGSPLPTYQYGDPSVLKVEILVPSNQVRRIIGKSGSVIQELQRTTGSTIKLSKETVLVSSSSNGNGDNIHSGSGGGDKTNVTPVELEMTPVSIIGDFHASFAAQRQIRLIVHRSTNVPSYISSSQPQPPQSSQQPIQGKTSSSKSGTQVAASSLANISGTKSVTTTTTTTTSSSSVTTSEPVASVGVSSSSSTSTARATLGSESVSPSPCSNTALSENISSPTNDDTNQQCTPDPEKS